MNPNSMNPVNVVSTLPSEYVHTIFGHFIQIGRMREHFEYEIESLKSMVSLKQTDPQFMI